MQNKLTPAERELVAIGASLAANCAPCIAYHIAAARKAGLDDEQIAEAVQLAEKVRDVPAQAVVDAAMRALPEQFQESDSTGPARCCP